MTIESNPQTTALATRQTPNQVTQHRVAIIFVPGIMGSRIQMPNDVAWDPDSVPNMMRWGSRWTGTKREILDSANAGTILLEPSDEFPGDVHADRVLRGFGGVRWKSYGTFLEFLERLTFGSHQTPLYVYGYDWRQPIIQLGCQLAADILGTTVSHEGNRASPIANRYGGRGILTHANTDQCIILTHSMGGLVSRAALKASSALQGKTTAILHGVQPATGAPAMHRRLITGMFAPVDGGNAAPDRVLRSILGKTGDEMGQIAGVIPGAMQLLPSNLYRQDADNIGVGMVSWTNFEESRSTLYGLTSDIYDSFRRGHTSGPPGILRPTLPVAARNALNQRILGLERFHTFIQRWKLANKTWAFFGDGVNSDSTVHFDLPPMRINVEERMIRSNVYTAMDPNGGSVTLDHNRDIARNGYSQIPRGQTPNASHPWGFGPFGDGTVARISGAALFSASETADSATRPWDFSTHKQFSFDGLEHEPAYRDRAVQRFCRDWIRHAIGLLR
ncbi:MAG: hypothetical protein ACJAS1_000437 [Oleiphilaceae bacterium]|jgi:hypothetical protein